MLNGLLTVVVTGSGLLLFVSFDGPVFEPITDVKAPIFGMELAAGVSLFGVVPLVACFLGPNISFDGPVLNGF